MIGQTILTRKGHGHVGDLDVRRNYLQELQRSEGRVIFTNADWADGWRGFVDGTIEQGQQAAQRVVAALKSDVDILRP